MFFMNLAPVSAVQTDWHPFGASQNFSLPVAFSDSGEEFSAVRNTINVNVQMIIENLQTNDLPCAMNNDPSSNAQTNIAAKRQSEGVLDGTSIRVLKGAAVEDLKTGYPPCTLGTEESSLGHCILDSDSDESVDRDIEEAIQEYLKKKTEDPSLISKSVHDTSVPPGTHEAIEDSAADVSNGISCGREAVDPTKLGLDFVNIVGLDAAGSRCSSPSSVSSNDSFELSIQAEIERFLQDKRNKETGSSSTSAPKSELASAGRTEHKENLVKVGQKKRKRCVKSSTGNPTHLVKQSVMNTNSQACSTKSSHFGEPGTACRPEQGSEGNPKGNKKLASRKKPRARHRFKELYKSSNAQWSLNAEFAEPRANPITACGELSDSSSDDGIEEAIQLYQLEQKKGKTKDVAFVLGLLSHKPPSTQKGADSSSCARSMEKETLEATVSKKWIHCAPKPGEFCPPNLSDTDSSDQSSNDFVTQSERNTTDSRLGWKKRFQAETLSESSPKREGPLATKVQPSADSIIDSTASEREERAGKGKATTECAAVSKQVMSSSDSENSSADSSDSIEKEIQNYLALKANQSSQKSNGVGAVSELNRTFPQELKGEDSLNDSPSLFSSLSSSSSRTSLLQKGRMKNKVSTDHELGMEKLRESQPPELSGGPVALTNDGTITSKIKLKGSSSAQDIWYGRTVNRDEEKLSPMDWIGEKLSCVKHVHDSWQTDEKSSSLDSDEDLDTATKDLLKTRRKLGKRSRDAKNWCKKRVRFTGAEVLTYSEQSAGIGDQTFRATGEGLTASHGPLKSCLSKSSKAACRRYLNLKRKGNKKAGEQSESESSSKISGIAKPKIGLLCGAPSSTAEGLTWKNVTAGDSSSPDSDDGIEQEILRFLAEKARVNSRLDKLTNNQNKVQGFNQQVEEGRLSEMAAQVTTPSPLSQQAEGSHNINTKGPHHLADEPAAGYLQRDTKRAGTESKTDVKGQDLLQDIHGTFSAQRQAEHRHVAREPAAASKTENKAGITQGSLQAGNTDCPGKGASNCHSGWHSDILQDKEFNTTPENCITQNIQDKWTALALETTQPLVQKQSVQNLDPRLWGAGQHQPKADQIRSSEKTINKLWGVFQTNPLDDTVSVARGKGTCREYFRDNQSDIGCCTDQISQAVVNTHSCLDWADSAKLKSEEGKNPGQPLGTLMPSLSLGAHSSKASRLHCAARHEQSDHNYQSEMRNEVREQSEAVLRDSDCVTQHLFEVTGPTSCLPVAAPIIASTHKETRIEQRDHSVGAETATETLIAEGASDGEVISQCTSREGGETLPAAQQQPQSQALSGCKIEEQNDRATRTEEATEGKAPKAFYDKASDHSGGDSRVDTDRSGLQRQGAES
ncbi:protein phosphatase 1 regulatory subunit 26 [Carcharodon carcharias]|uniref:protein phosphatase 1 regulatory subunit 26 n=1 Tax=Carcharodon carcharias TaxID=13397 RepID=UPI001B7E19C7|nr:protein phosphatase 1 regulatory subunit 26 [Carcharodon carcharias]XP_041049614.1 protein phosphatase 1 regulatory subunit 26 [Carcharodon carcharias]XP_041049615.1 protein phosphatase 1 regulatory subunit 26 [Carcharodon carcharias]XP_041049616.1 protein phosphatase 1 regulatory subunit 26 [Carcharodon carcharias]XP_041049617.1 protein phosphatase 1 regulatory subunit 26 [Carcharodon carcharias]XP_041049618.1 protein phosphatase 1 regulatory subunit 26 [Carcharodon carcharias]